MSRTLNDVLDGTQPCLDDPEAFFPSAESPGATERARAMCRRCWFQEPCLRYALAHRVHGIWGGSTLGERDAYRKARKSARCP